MEDWRGVELWCRGCMHEGEDMGVYREIQQFVEEHRDCGKVTGTVARPTVEGYSVSVTCDCGEVLSRWVTPESARHDLIYSTLLCSPN